jgi:hypothetical protein
MENKKAIDDVRDKECCPKFNPEPWDGKVIEWKNKKFIKDRVRTFMYIPLGFGSAMMRLMKKLEMSGVKSSDLLCFLIILQNGIWIFTYPLIKKSKVLKM